MLLFGINMLEPNFAFVSPYLTNHQEMTTVHPGLPNTRHLYYIYLSLSVCSCLQGSRKSASLSDSFPQSHCLPLSTPRYGRLNVRTQHFLHRST